jgi:N6-L-threonylcarbamoyladenine synthase
MRRELLAVNPRPTAQEWREITPQPTLNLLASFQKTVIDELMRRIITAVEQIEAKTVIISGGVASNRGLRNAAAATILPARVLFPAPELSTDNAAMIAAAAFPKYQRRELADLSLAARANLTLA